VERIHTDERDKSVHYLIDSNSSGLYEIKVLLDLPKKDLETFKNSLLAQFDAQSIYYQKANILNPNSCPNFYRFKIYPQIYERIERVYQIEEFMGKPFFEAFAKYCNENWKLILK